MKSGKKIIGFIVMIVMVLAITIGYSYLSTTLNINGTSKIGVASWDVHFANIQVATGSVTGSKVTQAPSISGTTLTYGVELDNPGEYYEFTVDVVNGGSVNAKLASLPSVSGVSSAQSVYTEYTFTHADGSAITNLNNEKIAANASKTYKVRVAFKDNISASQLPTQVQNMTLTVQLNYEQD